MNEIYHATSCFLMLFFWITIPYIFPYYRAFQVGHGLVTAAALIGFMAFGNIAQINAPSQAEMDALRQFFYLFMLAYVVLLCVANLVRLAKSPRIKQKAEV